MLDCNRCFPTKAIRGWLATDDSGRAAIVAEYFARTGPWRDLQAELRTAGRSGDPLYSVHARAAESPGSGTAIKDC